MKILVLSFYYQPDLCAGSFRCTALIKELRKHHEGLIHVVTTMPNRYSSFQQDALSTEVDEGLTIDRITLPNHNSGMIDQSKAFYHFYKEANKLISGEKYDLVFATSSRLFTAFLGARIANKQNVPLYLDIRDIFVDTLKDVLPKKLSLLALPVLKYLENYTFNSAVKINLVSEGFSQYFKTYHPRMGYDHFTNGIDDVFTNRVSPTPRNSRKTVVYGGNMGEGQGLHKIIPHLAKALPEWDFILIGDGGRRKHLEDVSSEMKCNNIQLKNPMDREALIQEYQTADVLFLHLNSYEAFEKVLPSKIFEYAALGKPIWAGVSGYAAEFLKENVNNAVVFSPCDDKDALKKLTELKLETQKRASFDVNFSRENIMKEMSKSLLKLLD